MKLSLSCCRKVGRVRPLKRRLKFSAIEVVFVRKRRNKVVSRALSSLCKSIWSVAPTFFRKNGGSKPSLYEISVINNTPNPRVILERQRRILRGDKTENYIYYIYILTNFNNKVLYTGMTNNLCRRTYEHKLEFNDSFSKKYKTHKLVYYEIYNHPQDAIAREKQIKGFLRVKKIALIEKMNPEWKDLSEKF